MGTPSESLARALAAVDADEAIALTRRWVEVNSYTSNVDGVNRVGAMPEPDEPVMPWTWITA